ncbi:phosphatase PAP2 family protein [Labrys okinawensis]|uniref:phosphatase PAP2 family protein n=1 Tax=Labrys okinawensis TaxID=346911 RepID=UPI0039BC83F0
MEFEALNRSLFLAMNADASSLRATIEAASLIAVFAILVVPLLLCRDWLRGEREQRETALLALATILLALGLNQVIGLFLFLPRPFAIPLGHTFLASATDTSFPSDHATVLFAAVASYWAGRRWIAASMLSVVALAVSWARIYLGVHMPLDIAGAMVTSLIAVGIAEVSMRWMGGPLLSFGEAVYRLLFGPLIKLGWIRP